MRERQIKISDTRRELNFAEPNLDNARAYGLEGYSRHLNEFVAVKKTLGSMAARFSLSIEQEYRDLTVAEIGTTNEASCSEAVDALKGEYRELLGLLIDQNVTNGELSRESHLASRSLGLVGADDPYIILERTRLLMTGKLDDDYRFAIGKRMVFALPQGVWNAVGALSRRSELPAIEITEGMLDKNDQYIVPISTAYYRLASLKTK